MVPSTCLHVLIMQHEALRVRNSVVLRKKAHPVSGFKTAALDVVSPLFALATRHIHTLHCHSLSAVEVDAHLRTAIYRSATSVFCETSSRQTSVVSAHQVHMSGTGIHNYSGGTAFQQIKAEVINTRHNGHMMDICEIVCSAQFTTLPQPVYKCSLQVLPGAFNGLFNAPVAHHPNLLDK